MLWLQISREAIQAAEQPQIVAAEDSIKCNRSVPSDQTDVLQGTCDNSLIRGALLQQADSTQVRMQQLLQDISNLDRYLPLVATIAYILCYLVRPS